jgi:hypothetical protein
VGELWFFEQEEMNYSGKQPPKNDRFFHSIAGFEIVFEAIIRPKAIRPYGKREGEQMDARGAPSERFAYPTECHLLVLG